MTKPFQFSGVILKYKDKYIFQHRDDKKGIASPGKYSGFGGHILDHEQPIQAAKRELGEETSLDIDSLEFKHLGTLTTDKDGFGHFYLVEIGDDHIKVFEGQGKYETDLSDYDLAKFAVSTAEAVEKWLLKK